MENEETTVVDNDCGFVDIGVVKQYVSDEKRSWNFWKLFLFRLQNLFFLHMSVFFFHFAKFVSFKRISLKPYLWRDCHLPFDTVQYSCVLVTNFKVKLNNKMISSKDCLFVAIFGPSESGKTDLGTGSTFFSS